MRKIRPSIALWAVLVVSLVVAACAGGASQQNLSTVGDAVAEGASSRDASGGQTYEFAPVPGASGDPGSGAATGERPNARDELWIPIVLLALLVLTAEWLVYERDTVTRLRRGIAGRLRRTPTTGRGA